MGTAATIDDATTALVRTTTRAEVSAIAGRAVRELTGADDAVLVLGEDDRLVAHGLRGDHTATPLSGEGCLAAVVVRTGEAVAVPDVHAEPTVALLAPEVHGVCIVPAGSGPTTGALAALWHTRRLTTAADLRALEALAAATALAVAAVDARHEALAARAEVERLTRRGDDLEVALHTLAHDLRGPLGAVLGYAEMLRDDLAEDPAAVRRTADTVVATSGRMDRQIDRMLGLYEHAARQLRAMPLDLTRLARTVADEALVGLDRDVVVEVTEGLVAHADADLMRVVLHNLLSNAVKFTDARTTARIGVGSAAAPGDAPSDGARLRWFYVEDDGVGFDPADAHRLFRPLGRLHAGTHPGTGLGLASVAWIVARHGGRVHAESRPDPGGARFWFGLPATPVTGPPAPLTAVR